VDNRLGEVVKARDQPNAGPPSPCRRRPGSTGPNGLCCCWPAGRRAGCRRALEELGISAAPGEMLPLGRRTLKG